ncbi:FUSC family protein [Enterococcus timonensis]|uniref:FUSC family protein n=1 Tax=Enterococcus timonensis TaxID=1852364 RepID=UPI0008DA9A2B|nr:aromatic acid exporter family protein [Enterococcus timonensis]
MKLGRFRLGMRTIKTALAVFIVLVLFQWTNRSTPIIAALSAVFALRQDLTRSVSFSKSKILGNVIGAFFGLVLSSLGMFFPENSNWVIFCLPIFVILTIVFSDGIGNNMGIVSAISTLLLVSLGLFEEPNFLYAVNRVLDTFIGTTIAITINAAIKPNPKLKKRAIVEDLKNLKQKENELEKLKEKVEAELKETGYQK